MNRTPPQPQLTDPAANISPDALAVIGTLARTYNAQRRRLLERRAPGTKTAPSPLRPLSALESALWLDGAPVSASIVDAVVQAPKLAGYALAAVVLPLPNDQSAAAEAGWWDALLGDVERRTGLAPRSIAVALDPETAPEVRAVFAGRGST